MDVLPLLRGRDRRISFPDCVDGPLLPPTIDCLSLLSTPFRLVLFVFLPLSFASKTVVISLSPRIN